MPEDVDSYVFNINLAHRNITIDVLTEKEPSSGCIVILLCTRLVLKT